MFHVWYNYNMKVTTKTNLLNRGMKRGSKVVQEYFYVHCHLLIFDVLKHIYDLNKFMYYAIQEHYNSFF